MLNIVAMLTALGVVGNATPVVKVIALGLIAAMIAAGVIGVLKVRAGAGLTGGSAFLAGLRLGGPFIGCLGGAYGAMNIFIGLANAPVQPSIRVVAPGIAEVILLIGLGFLSGAVAVIAHSAVEARIDRTVLRA